MSKHCPGEQDRRCTYDQCGNGEKRSSPPARARSHLRRFRFGGGLRDGRDKPVTLPGNGLNVNRMVRRIVQSLAQLSNRGIKAPLKLNEGVRRPKPRSKPLTSDYFSRLFQKNFQNAQRLLLNMHAVAVFSQL